jgi:hypothetical protein
VLLPLLRLLAKLLLLLLLLLLANLLVWLLLDRLLLWQGWVCCRGCWKPLVAALPAIGSSCGPSLCCASSCMPHPLPCCCLLQSQPFCSSGCHCSRVLGPGRLLLQ